MVKHIKKSNVYKSLQASRAISAILVVLFHLGETIALEKYFGYKIFSVPFLFGSAGVNFFFVLSGFITLQAHRYDIFKPNKLVLYFKKRLVRIYPTYWIVFISVFFLAKVSPSLRASVPSDLVTILKSLLIIPQDKNIVGGTGAPVILVAWTLQYEMFFYLCFASLISSRWLSIGIGLTFLYLFINNIGASALQFPLSFLLQDYTLLFVMGMIVALLCISDKVIVYKPLIYAIFGVLIFGTLSLDTVLQTNSIEQKTILYGLASSLIILGLVKAEDNGLIIGEHSWLQTLGNSSYTLYLIHFPLISILCKLCLSIQLNKLGLLGGFIAYFAIFGICLIVAVVFHLWIEKPVLQYLRSRAINEHLSESH